MENNIEIYYLKENKKQEKTLIFSCFSLNIYGFNSR